MSKIAKAIQAKIDHNEAYALSTNLNYFTAGTDIKEVDIGSQIAYRYSIGCKIESDMFVPKSEIREATKLVKRAVIEEIFGEFRPLIYDIQVALYDRDTGRANRLMQDLSFKMFEEGM